MKLDYIIVGQGIAGTMLSWFLLQRGKKIVVIDTPKVADAAVLIVQSAFTSAGQRCTAARRLIVKASMYDAVIDEVKTLAGRILFGEPFGDPAEGGGASRGGRSRSSCRDGRRSCRPGR